jgi:glycosyltransferase involved in cell wall biosynthesis
MSEARVSVALCTHNGARFLQTQLESILDQTHVPDEIVLSDDASSDGTMDLVESVWRSRFPPGDDPAVDLVVLRNERALGVTRNFEQAIAACSGDIIVLCDQDDVWYPDRVAVAVGAFVDDPALTLVFSNADVIDEEGIVDGRSLFGALEFQDAQLDEFRRGRAFEVLLRRNVVTGAATAFRASLRERMLPIPDGWIHDEWAAIIAAITGRVGVVNAALLGYRLHGDNQIGVRQPTLRAKIDRVFSERGDRNVILWRRSQALLDRYVTALSTYEPDRESELRQKVEHESVRAMLPRNRLLRVPRIIREARSGRYQRYSSQGSLDVLRDLLQPA